MTGTMVYLKEESEQEHEESSPTSTVPQTLLGLIDFSYGVHAKYFHCISRCPYFLGESKSRRSKVAGPGDEVMVANLKWLAIYYSSPTNSLNCC